MRNLTVCEALAGEAFDRVNDQHSEEFDKIFFQKKSNARGGDGPFLSLTDTLPFFSLTPIAEKEKKMNEKEREIF